MRQILINRPIEIVPSCAFEGSKERFSIRETAFEISYASFLFTLLDPMSYPKYSRIKKYRSPSFSRALSSRLRSTPFFSKTSEPIFSSSQFSSKPFQAKVIKIDEFKLWEALCEISRLLGTKTPARVIYCLGHFWPQFKHAWQIWIKPHSLTF